VGGKGGDSSRTGGKPKVLFRRRIEGKKGKLVPACDEGKKLCQDAIAEKREKNLPD